MSCCLPSVRHTTEVWDALLPHPKLRAEEELWAYESFEIAGGLGQAGEIAVEDKGDRHYCWGGGSWWPRCQVDALICQALDLGWFVAERWQGQSWHRLS